MGEILAFRRPRPSERHKGKGLCRDGHHQWAVDRETRFDVQTGRLVTVLRCERCGAVRNRYT
jgi:hypothetical protein